MDKLKLMLVLLNILFIFAFSISQSYAQGYGRQNRGQTMQQGLGPADKNYDLRFINRMIIHHERAVSMSKDALQKAQHSELKQMAQNIIDNQTKEIQQMKIWRKQWYGQ